MTSVGQLLTSKMDDYAKIKFSMKFFRQDFGTDIHTVNLFYYKDFFDSIKQKQLSSRDEKLYIYSHLAAVFACEIDFMKEYEDVCQIIKQI